MLLLIGKTGEVNCLYDESIDLTEIGFLSIRRAARVVTDIVRDR